MKLDHLTKTSKLASCHLGGCSLIVPSSCLSSYRSLGRKGLVNSPLEQIRRRYPNRSHLMDLIWKGRSTPDSFQQGDLQVIRNRPFHQQSLSTIKSTSKRMSDSFLEVTLPFCQDADLRAEYVSIHGGLRFGKVMEDLDALAASIAYLYCDDADLTLVTAAVDRIDLLEEFNNIVNLRLRGMVTYVGHSSMEITMSVESSNAKLIESSNEKKSNTQGDPTTWKLGALAKFVFVARSKDGKQAIKIPRLNIESEGERELFRLGQERHQYRLRRNETSLFRQPPIEAESQLLHDLLMNPSLKDPMAVPISRTAISSIRLCHPQDRNVHNFIFGGYLMREAFELAYTTAVLHTKGQSTFVTTVEDINFVHPVPIGSLLKFSAQIVCTDTGDRGTDHVTSKKGSSQKNQAAIETYTLLKRLHVAVVADVIDPQQGTSVTTNTFHYTFATRAPIPPVVPETYHDAMSFLEGKRRLQMTSK